MNSKKILVTGADGFIGSHLTESLIRGGYEVKAFVLYNSFNSWGWLDYCDEDIRGEFEVVSGDVRDAWSVKAAATGCGKIIHLASLIAIPYSYQAPSSYVETNVSGTLNVLQAALDLNLERVIHTSTSEVYGTAKFVPMTEQHPLQGQSPYSATKIAADQLAYSYYSSFELPVVTLRPFNTYGPRQSARAVIPTIIGQILSGVKQINLGAASPTRDFNYIKDTVSGFMAALRSDDGVGEVINLGSNYEISIGETVELIAEILNTKISIYSDVERFRPKMSEVTRLWCDNSKAIKTLDWKPEYNGKLGLRRGLEKTIKWMQESKNLKRYKFNAYNI
jgi:NAD dependent epimerase/dehydratase